MGAPRKHKIDIENLYVKLDKRNNKTYWQYKDPLTQTWLSFGTCEVTAKTAATELNRLFASQQVEQSFALIDLAKKKRAGNGVDVRFKDWVEKYLALLDKKQQKGELSKPTVDGRKRAANILCARIANTPLKEVGSREMAAILEEFIDQGKFSQAKNFRADWVDIFKEAQYAGEVPPGFNPVMATRKPQTKVTRARLKLDDWLRILDHAKKRESPWAVNALLLAVISGQRLSDILKMKFKDIRDGYLYIVQGKTGAKLALPLSLRCEAIDMSLGEVVERCRDNALSQYLVHHFRTTKKYRSGDPINKATASTMFARCRDHVGIVPPEGKTPTSFHEQRSLSERLYQKQGIDTQKLLGHKSAAMTEMYHDERDDGWTFIAAR
jgi:integrase